MLCSPAQHDGWCIVGAQSTTAIEGPAPFYTGMGEAQRARHYPRLVCRRGLGSGCLYVLWGSLSPSLGHWGKSARHRGGGVESHLPTITQRLLTADHRAQWCSSSCSWAMSWPRLPPSGGGCRLSGGTDTRDTSPSSRDTARAEQWPLRGLAQTHVKAHPGPREAPMLHGDPQRPSGSA